MGYDLLMFLAVAFGVGEACVSYGGKFFITHDGKFGYVVLGAGPAAGAHVFDTLAELDQFLWG